MTDAFDVAGEFLPASDSNTESFTDSFVDNSAQPSEGAVEGTEATEAAADVPNGFIALGLAPELIQAVKDLGFTQPTAVQIKTIPLALQGQGTSASDKATAVIDLMVSSQTGSGKTAAFLLPVLHTLLMQQAQAEEDERADYERAVVEAAAKGEPAPKRAKRKDPTNPRNFKAAAPGALILCPTRELAQQVAHDAIDLVQHCRGLRIANVVGGMPYQLQIAKLQNANLVVATPGRLLDLQRSQQIKLDQVQFLVVDEADRMLDLGFSDDLAEVNQLTIDRRQTMMFSATFASRIQQLAARVMRAPQRIQIDSPTEKHVNIKQVLFWADNAHHKRKMLDHWLRDTTINQAIVFSSTQVECDGLANDLQQEGFSAVALHGALSQGIRNRRLMALRQGQVQILVATDVAARGLDVPTVSHVFNFGLPMKAEDYTHRIGRTGRAGRDGIAVTFAEIRDRRKIYDIEAYTRQQLKAETIPGLEPQQRFSESRPGNSFGGRGGNGGGGSFSRDRNFSAPARAPYKSGAGSYQNASASQPHDPRFAARDDRGGDAGRDTSNYVRKGGFNDRHSNDKFAGQGRSDGAPRQDFAPRAERTDFAPRQDRGDFAPRQDRGDFAPRADRSDFAPRKPLSIKPGFAKPAGGKVFVPRDAKKRPTRSAE